MAVFGTMAIFWPGYADIFDETERIDIWLMHIVSQFFLFRNEPCAREAKQCWTTVFLDLGRLDFNFRFQFQISSWPRGVREEKGKKG